VVLAGQGPTGRVGATGWVARMGQTPNAYGVLGVWAARRAGHDPGDKFWVSRRSTSADTPEQDGGWSYIPEDRRRTWRRLGLASRSSSSTCTRKEAYAGPTRVTSPRGTRLRPRRLSAAGLDSASTRAARTTASTHGIERTKGRGQRPAHHQAARLVREVAAGHMRGPAAGRL